MKQKLTELRIIRQTEKSTINFVYSNILPSVIDKHLDKLIKGREKPNNIMK